MTNRKRSYFNMKIVVGLLIIGAGVMLLLDSLNIISDYRLRDFWPVILIVIGLGKILQPKDYRHAYSGFIITAVGALFLLNNLGYIRFWFDDLWPILIILAGIEILRHGVFVHKTRWGCCDIHKDGKHKFNGWKGISDSNSADADIVDISVVLGGGEYKFTSKQLKGGGISSIMGGCELDFRNAEMENEEMVLEASSIMGGIEIKVPSHWEVILKGSPILGAVEDKTGKPENPTKKVIIKGAVIMGAIEVKN